MNESEALVVAQLIFLDAVLTSVLWFTWLRVTGTRSRLYSTNSKKGTFYSLAAKLTEQKDYVLFSLCAYSFPFVFLWITSLVVVPTASVEVFMSSWFLLLVLLLMVFVTVKDMSPNNFDTEDH